MGLLRVVLLIAGAAVALQTADGKFSGDATYYGDNGWAGSCMGNIRWASGRYNAAAWPPAGGQFGTRVALNSRQYSDNMCGKKIMFRGTGQGLGHSPVSTSWQRGMITNLCPECQYGDLDMGIGGDGRWNIEWFFVDDNSPGLSTEARSVQRAKAPRRRSHKRRHSKKYWAKKRSARRRSVKSRKSSHWGRVWKNLKSRNSRKSRQMMKRLLRKQRAKKRRAQQG